MTVKIFLNRHDNDVSAATLGSNSVPSNMFEQFFSGLFFFFLFVSARPGERAGHGRAGEIWEGADA